jgi:NAD(P)-dependent dehydrogenase (short-subunit alcohol dehydrogenase family)
VFDGKVVMVTGAAGALGQATTQHFIDRGARLVCLDYSDELLAQAFGDAVSASGSGHIYRAVDLTVRDNCAACCKEILAQVGQVDVLANIAGGFMMGDPVHSTSDETWDFLFNLNTRSIMNMSAGIVPGMIAAASGKIINVAARAATAGAAHMGVYTATKAAVMRLTESMALELRGNGINVNCILPGTIDTPRNRQGMPDADHASWVPTADLAEVIGFLASDAARAVQGAGIAVDGLS